MTLTSAEVDQGLHLRRLDREDVTRLSRGDRVYELVRHSDGLTKYKALTVDKTEGGVSVRVFDVDNHTKGARSMMFSKLYIERTVIERKGVPRRKLEAVPSVPTECRPSADVGTEVALDAEDQAMVDMMRARVADVDAEIAKLEASVGVSEADDAHDRLISKLTSAIETLQSQLQMARETKEKEREATSQLRASVDTRLTYLRKRRARYVSTLEGASDE